MSEKIDSGRMPATEEQIDAALRAVGSALPESGLHGRILNRLAAERMVSDSAPVGFAGLMRRMPRFGGAALTAACVCIAGSAVVIGSVQHSRRLHNAPVVAPLVPGISGNGIGAASAVHPAAPVSVPVPATRPSRGRPGRAANRGRARIQRHAHKASGVAVPAPDENSPK